MNCQSCADVGIIRVPWSNAPDDFAICLCDAGAAMRRSWNPDETRARFEVWQLWAAREQVDPSRVFLLDEILAPAELAERGFSAPQAPTIAAQEAVLLAAGKRRAKL